MNKSAQSCIWSIRSLLEQKKTAYLWTFTFRERLDIPEACERWQRLQRDLVRTVGFRGVRVYELHPNGHGLHIHVVTCGRHDVRAVRHFAEASGFGRIHVKPVPASSSDYIAKYLTKARRSPLLKGRRLWACLGFKGAKVADCEIDTPITREIAKISNDDLKSYYDSMSWVFPSSPKSINYAKFMWARARLISREIQIAMSRYPSVSESVSNFSTVHLKRLGLWISGKKAARDHVISVLRSSSLEGRAVA